LPRLYRNATGFSVNRPPGWRARRWLIAGVLVGVARFLAGVALQGGLGLGRAGAGWHRGGSGRDRRRAPLRRRGARGRAAARKRLQLCAMLAAGDESEFAGLRGALGVSDSVLSKQLNVLEDAGYLKLNKTTIDSRVRTRASLTEAGRRAFAAHVAELQRIVVGAAAIAPAH
jgi:DNA-binding MarR family transcriptional regulator